MSLAETQRRSQTWIRSGEEKVELAAARIKTVFSENEMNKLVKRIDLAHCLKFPELHPEVEYILFNEEPKSGVGWLSRLHLNIEKRVRK